MTKQIRKRVFETNSSSSHSLTVAPGDLVSQPFPDSVLRSGELSVRVNEYGWEWYRYYSPAHKISYLLTQITSGDLPDEDDLEEGESLTDALRARYEKFNTLCNVVKAHTGVNILVVKSSGYVDHESVGLGMDLFGDEEKLKQFLFSKDSYVETGNDNSGPSAKMSTDRGPEDTYAPFYGTPAPGSLATKLVLHKWPTRLESTTGQVIECDSPVMAQILATGVVVAVEWSNSCHYGLFDYEEPLGETMDTLAEQGFKFSSALDVTERAVLKAKDPREGKTIALLTVMLPEELASRFAEVH